MAGSGSLFDNLIDEDLNPQITLKGKEEENFTFEEWDKYVVNYKEPIKAGVISKEAMKARQDGIGKTLNKTAFETVSRKETQASSNEENNLFNTFAEQLPNGGSIKKGCDLTEDNLDWVKVNDRNDRYACRKYGDFVKRHLERILGNNGESYSYIYFDNTLDLSKQLLYVGEGKEQRFKAHIVEINNEKNEMFKHKTMRELARVDDRKDSKLSVKRITGDCSKKFAQILESAIIKLYGVDSLLNIKRETPFANFPELAADSFAYAVLKDCEENESKKIIFNEEIRKFRVEK